ncbi:MAG: type II/IV secretion system protein, partial [Deltaproteobacteria bacterium]|nr:type II/IV secretion system protein [Deltaproteobacteria bacterium]
MTTTSAAAPARHIPAEILRDRAMSVATLARVGCTTIEQLADVIATQYKLPRLELDAVDLSRDLVPLLSRARAEQHRIVPVFASPQELTLAVCDPTTVALFDWLAHDIKRSVLIVISTPGEIQRAQRRLYETRVASPEADADVDVSQEALAEASTIVSRIFGTAIAQRASDIHFEATDRLTLVRFRVDGVLRQVETRPIELHPAIVSRIKVLAQLDISIRQLPQDGRIRLTTGASVDLRVSILPTYFGEKVVCRLLDNSRAAMPLDALGFEPGHERDLRHMLQSPYGLVLVTGPTGSGKSTTLYAALNAVRTPDVNVVTVEDPVEYQIPGINQVPINPRRGLTFAGALRSILRQDPDVILVGEIRDQETGVLAAEAALTGHLVLSSLHTNDAIGAVLRLSEMGVAPYLISPTLLGVVSQRLVRKICTTCIERYKPDAGELALVGLPSVPPGTQVARGRGCSACHGSGMFGRTAVREVLTIDDTMRTMISRDCTADELRLYAAKIGFRTMRFSALRLWLAGVT